MRWTPGDPNADVEDERGSGGGGGGGFRIGGPHIGIGGFIVLLLLSFIFKRNFFALLGGGGSPSSGPAVSGPSNAGTPAAGDDQGKKFVGAMLRDIQNTWEQEFAKMGQPYRHAKLVLFTDQVRSGCGFAEMAMGPFYCPVDEKAYIDLGFYRELQTRFGAPGEFAEAYVLAHEIGHHVQKLLGISDKVTAAQERDRSQVNALSVRLELQADCFAGIWAHSVKQRSSDEKSPIAIDESDVESAINAAAAVGDDRIQKQATGSVNPETWTHGSSKMRVQWFRTGMETGDINRCDTFAR